MTIIESPDNAVHNKQCHLNGNSIVQEINDKIQQRFVEGQAVGHP